MFSLTASNFLLIGSVIILSSIIITKFGSRFGVPTLLLFLLAGMLFGSDGLGIQIQKNNIAEVQLVGMIALCIILFSGGMETAFSEIKPVVRQGVALSTIGVLLTTVFTGYFIYWGCTVFTPYEPSLAFCLLLAATMSSTDSASVFNILRTQGIGLRKHSRPLLELESGSNDPMAYMLTIALIQVCQEPEGFNVWSISLKLVIQFVVGSLMGYLIGKATIWFINKINLKNVALYPIILICVIFITFSLTELFKGNGYLAVYLAGIIVGNKPLVKKRDCIKFLDGLTWLVQIIMFLALGLLVNPHEMVDIALFAIIIGVFVIFLGRPLAVFISLLPFRRPVFKTKLFVSWVGLRGATPIIFATYPVAANIPGSEFIFNIVFFITILSLIIQGTTIPFFANLLEMRRDLPKEGNDFGVELPEEIDSKLFDVTVTDDMLNAGCQIKNLSLPEGILIIMVKRDNKYLVPNGSLKLHPDDKLLVIAQSDVVQEHKLQK